MPDISVPDLLLVVGTVVYARRDIGTERKGRIIRAGTRGTVSDIDYIGINDAMQRVPRVYFNNGIHWLCVYFQNELTTELTDVAASALAR